MSAPRDRLGVEVGAHHDVQSIGQQLRQMPDDPCRAAAPLEDPQPLWGCRLAGDSGDEARVFQAALQIDVVVGVCEGVKRQ